jgi:hypothetical protein
LDFQPRRTLTTPVLWVRNLGSGRICNSLFASLFQQGKGHRAQGKIVARRHRLRGILP